MSDQPLTVLGRMGCVKDMDRRGNTCLLGVLKKITPKTRMKLKKLWNKCVLPKIVWFERMVFLLVNVFLEKMFVFLECCIVGMNMLESIVRCWLEIRVFVGPWRFVKVLERLSLKLTMTKGFEEVLNIGLDLREDLFLLGPKCMFGDRGNKKKNGNVAMYWRGPGTVIGSSDQCSKFWVSFGSKVLKCSPEQLRRLKPEQEAQIQLVPKEVVDWNKQVSDRGVATYHDISYGATPADDATDTDHWIMEGNVLKRIHVQPRHQLYVPCVEDNPPIEISDLLDKRTTNIQYSDGQQETIEDNWKTDGTGVKDGRRKWTGETWFWASKRSRDNEDMNTSMEVDGNERNVRPRLEQDTAFGNGLDEQEDGNEDHEDDSEEMESTQTPGENDASVGEPAQDHGAAMEEEPIPQPPTVPESELAGEMVPGPYGPVRVTPLTQALRRNLMTLDLGRPARTSNDNEVFMVTDNGQEQQRPNNEDGFRYVGKGWKIDWKTRTVMKMHTARQSKFTPHKAGCPLPTSWLLGSRVTCARYLDGKKETEYLVDDYKKCKNPHEHLRAQWSGYTAFQFQVPLEVESTEDGEYEVNEVTIAEASKMNEVDEGKTAELDKLLKYQAVELIPPRDAEKVRNCHVQGKRILPSRFVITRKPDEKTGVMKTKCRWCIRGYLDPDLADLQTQSPTVSQEAFMATLQTCANNQWRIQIADVEGAFLQGDKLQRDKGELYVELPPDGIPGLQKGTLLRVVKAVYGLGDAPRQWFQKIVGVLNNIGLRQSQLDQCLFHWWKDEVLQGILCLHVDDMVVAGSKCFHEEIIPKLKTSFPFKHWVEGRGQFLGRTLTQKEDGSIEIGQQEFCEKLKPCEISRERRRQKSERITDRETTQLRAITGAINWAVTSSRPDLAVGNAVLQQRTTRATVHDLVEANKLISEARDHSNLTLTVKPLPWDKLALLVPCDASWGTEQDLSSQAAYMICMTTQDVVEGHSVDVSPLKWKSYKQERQVNSTLAAETMAVSRGMAEACWMRFFFLEIMHSKFSLEEAKQLQHTIPVVTVTDNKPLFDFARNDVTVSQDKRLMIEMLLMRRDILKNNVVLRWIDTKQMLVDCMTKTKVRPFLLRYVLMSGKYAIMQEKDMLEAKANDRLLKQLKTEQKQDNSKCDMVTPMKK